MQRLKPLSAQPHPAALCLRRSIALLLLSACAALTACGGGDPEDEQEPTTCSAQQCGRTN